MMNPKCEKEVRTYFRSFNESLKSRTLLNFKVNKWKSEFFKLRKGKENFKSKKWKEYNT